MLRNIIIKIISVAPIKIAGLLLPTFAASVLGRTEYTNFTLAYVTAMAVSAFSGESLSAAVSRHVRQTTCLPSIFLKIALLIFFSTICLVSVSYIFSLDNQIGVGNILMLISIALFCLINIFIPPALSIILFHKTTVATVAVIFLLVLTAATAAFAFGGTGYVGFVIGYCLVLFIGFIVFLTFVIRAAYLPSTLTSAEGRQFSKSFLLIALAAVFGGPVHGICMLLLGSVEPTGKSQLAIFVLYYPFAMLVSFIPSLNAPFIIQKLAGNGEDQKNPKLAKIFGRNILLMSFVCALLLIASSIIHQYYKTRIGEHSNLLFIMSLIGFLLGLLSVSSSILIAIKTPQSLLKPSVFYAVCYLTVTYAGVVYSNFDAFGVALSLAFSLCMLLLYHLVLIFVNSSQSTS